MQSPPSRFRPGTRLRVDLSLRDPRAPRGCTCSWAQARRGSHCLHGRGEVGWMSPARRGWLELPRILSSTQPLGLVRAWSWCGRSSRCWSIHWPRHWHHPFRKVAAIHCTPAPMPVAKSCTSCAIVPTPAQHCLETLGTPRQPAGTRIRADRHRSGAGLDGVAPLGHEARIARLARWVDMAEREKAGTRCCFQPSPFGPGQAPATTTCACAHWR